MNEYAELAYFAGFFDGEGCVGIGKHKQAQGYEQYQLFVVAENTNRTVLEAFKAKFGGFVMCHESKNLKHKPSYRWAMYSGQAASFLEQVLPYLVVKREQALLGLEFASLITRGGKALTNAEKRSRQECKTLMHIMNARG